MARDDDRFDWERPSSGYTFEGQIEDVGDLARGASRGNRTVVRIAALVLVSAMLLPVVGVAVWAISSWLG